MAVSLTVVAYDRGDRVAVARHRYALLEFARTVIVLETLGKEHLGQPDRAEEEQGTDHEGKLRRDG